jgi:hypothetical protein
MSRKLRHRACAAALLTIAVGPIPALACAFDDGSPAAGLFDRDFLAVNAQASTVYFAITDALAQGLLERSAFQPTEAGAAGYWRAAARINALHRKIAGVVERTGRPAPAMALLLIESSLWAQLTPGPQGLTLSLHVSGARPGDAIVATSEAGLAAVLEGRLPAEIALARGLIAVGGANGDAVKELIAAALAEGNGASAAAPPVRLFGPAR